MDPFTGASQATQGSTHRGDAPLVLFALRPRVYSEAIVRIVAELRPGLEVLVVEPDELPAEMERRTPSLVLCSHPRPEGLNAAHWLEYRPYEDPEVVRVDGLDELLPGLRFQDLVGLVDRLAAGLPSGRLSGTPTAGTKDGYTIAGAGGTFSWKVPHEGDTNGDGVQHPNGHSCVEESTVTIDNGNTPGP